MDKLVALVSCTKNKKDGVYPARELYDSTLFNLIKNYLDNQNVDWWILSAKFGLIHNQVIIPTYDLSLSNLSKKERLYWFNNLVEPIINQLNYQKYIIFGGKYYREFIVPYLINQSKEVIIPFKSMGIGQQISLMQSGNFKV